MSLQRIASVALILVGAGVMLTSIARMNSVFETLKLVEGDRRDWLRHRLWVHRGLMAFFVLGYLATAFGLVVDAAFFIDLLVAAIYFFGAVFVFVGIALQNRMLAELVKTLDRLLPICAACKKIRRESGDALEQRDWQPVEEYISLHMEASFTHGYCPECAEELVPGLFDSSGSRLFDSSGSRLFDSSGSGLFDSSGSGG